MRSPIRFSAMILMSALMGAGCNGAQPQDPAAEAEVIAETAEVKQGAVGDVVLRCDEFQGGTHLEVVQTATGFEAAYVSEEYDPWDCRCTYTKREILGQYNQCRRSTVDPRIMNCFRVEPSGSVGKVVLSTTRVQKTQMVIGSSTTVNYSELSVAAINQDPGQTPRRDYVFPLSDCQ
ncbi:MULTISPECIES: hypothetical protein [Myxococcus]|uniref:hypothetical protein n=1 Tax=Myxococcus TaxID=32 RepID=UPI00112B2104|nr:MULTISPECIES: hypothetical protein [Myxococcus]QDE84093.1 hypothetical protein BHS07_22445 [Myxococcus xanthus]QDE98244.1 hypothetical protein BHS05_21690 [Myxococcus xanthus]QDF05959.1 hypothetical protein BHS04_22520 [Myxococcus xanthus]WAM23425.1 hypothetical protein OZ403_22965 [Myxococcus sp. NMCA1]